jgi:hypothetical protein
MGGNCGQSNAQFRAEIIKKAYRNACAIRELKPGRVFLSKSKTIHVAEKLRQEVALKGSVQTDTGSVKRDTSPVVKEATTELSRGVFRCQRAVYQATTTAGSTCMKRQSDLDEQNGKLIRQTLPFWQCIQILARSIYAAN